MYSYMCSIALRYLWSYANSAWTNKPFSNFLTFRNRNIILILAQQQLLTVDDANMLDSYTMSTHEIVIFDIDQEMIL